MRTTAILPSTSKIRLASQGPADRPPEGAQPGSYTAIQKGQVVSLGLFACAGSLPTGIWPG
jgi:hypothetical protein